MKAPTPNAVHVAAQLDGYYTLLGLKKTADESLVKKAYKRASLRHHPDKVGGDTKAFQILNRAKHVLSDATLRRRYDYFGLDVEEGTKVSPTDGDIDKGGMFSEELSAVVAVLLTCAFQIFLGAIFLFCTRYWVLESCVTIMFSLFAFLLLASKDDNTKNLELLPFEPRELIYLAIVGWLMWSYGPSYWVYTFCESYLLGHVLFLKSVVSFVAQTQTGLSNKNIFSQIAELFLRFILLCMAWWSHGRLYYYILFIILLIIAAPIMFLIFSFSESLINHTVDIKLKKVGEKVRAIIKQKEEEIKKWKKKN